MTLPGIDNLIKQDFKPVEGHRVGLITNHTGLTSDGIPTIDVLHQAPGVELAALFSPEHGIRGAFDSKVSDSRDDSTGTPIYSLYGETDRPTAGQLRGLTALVYDIQDVGCRFYTYITTLGYVLEEAARHQIKVIVLDRPNPIGGIAIEGPLADSDRLSFTAYHPIPVRHGMTVGELARLYNGERRIGADLSVVLCSGWRRRDWYDATGLTWVNPSPNMRTLTEATLYPAIGLLETTNLSVGRGTDTPFEVIGAPFIGWDGARALAATLNGAGLPGVRFIPIRFTPRASVHQGQLCGGVNIIVTNRETFLCLRTGLELACAVRNLFKSAWNIESYDRLLVNRQVFKAFKAGQSALQLEALWKPELSAFGRIRTKYLLYQ